MLWVITLTTNLLPGWLDVVLAFVILSGVGSAWWFRGSMKLTPRSAAAWASFAPPSSVAETVGLEALLPTQLPDFHFRFSALVSYRVLAGATHKNPAAAARAAVRDRAEAMARDLLPIEIDSAQVRLADALGHPVNDSVRGIVASVSDVKVDLDDDLSCAEKQVALLRDRRRRERSRDDERDVRRYFREEVLKDTGTALVWWLARQDMRRGDLGSEEIVEAVDLVDRLGILTAVTQNQYLPPASPVFPSPVPSEPLEASHRTDVGATVALVYRLFPTDETADERLFFVQELASNADDFGRSDYARRLRAEFGLTDDPKPNEPDTDADEPSSGCQIDEIDREKSATYRHSDDSRPDGIGSDDIGPDDPDNPGPDDPDDAGPVLVLR